MASQFTFEIKEALAKGLRPHARSRYNQPYLIQSKGCYPYQDWLQVVEQLNNYLLAELDAAGEATSLLNGLTFPYPQLFVFSDCNIVCTASKIFEFAAPNLTLKLDGLIAGGTWKALDFKTFIYLTNGAQSVKKDPATGVYSVTTDYPYANCCCNYNGQVLLGSPSNTPTIASPTIAQPLKLTATLDPSSDPLDKENGIYTLEEGKPYNVVVAVTASGGSGNTYFTYKLTNSPTVSGLTAFLRNNLLTIHGTPQGMGTTSLTVSAKDDAGGFATATFQALVVDSKGVPTVIVPPNPPPPHQDPGTNLPPDPANTLILSPDGTYTEITLQPGQVQYFKFTQRVVCPTTLKQLRCLSIAMNTGGGEGHLLIKSSNQGKASWITLDDYTYFFNKYGYKPGHDFTRDANGGGFFWGFIKGGAGETLAIFQSYPENAKFHQEDTYYALIYNAGKLPNTYRLSYRCY